MGDLSIGHASETVKSIALSSAEKIAKKMLDIPEGMKVAVARGRDGEGKEFCSFSDPMKDILAFPKEQQIDLKRMMVDEVYTSRDIRDRKQVVVPEYKDIIGFIRFPVELARKTEEKKLTPSNYSRLVEALIQELENNPERWITEI